MFWPLYRNTTSSDNLSTMPNSFVFSNRFAVGYCLDYNEVYRDLPHIGVINQLGIDKFRDYETKDHAAAAAAAVKEA